MSGIAGKCRKQVSLSRSALKQFHVFKETILMRTQRNLAGLQVIHQVETAKRDAEIHYLKTIERKRDQERKADRKPCKASDHGSIDRLLNRREFSC
jgi:hypothetical protein